MPPAPALRDAFVTPDAKRRHVRRLFHVIADRYDLITVLLSFGLDAGWKRRLVRMSSSLGAVRALDLACGTGDIAMELAASGMRVIGLDLTHRMLQLARQKRRGASGSVTYIGGDMSALPFADGSFQLVTTGYGLRNVPEIGADLSEIHRVLAPGGVLLSLDFNRPESLLLRSVYLTYLTIVGGVLGYLLHREPDTYRYIPESIRRYPGATIVCQLARGAGFQACEWHPVLGGLLAIHRVQK